MNGNSKLSAVSNLVLEDCQLRHPQASVRQQDIGVVSSLLWFVGPAICIWISPLIPRDPVEPEKMSFGAAAGLGMVLMGWLILCGIISSSLLWITWSITGRGYKLLVLSPFVIAGVFWLGLVAEGM